MPFVRRKLKTSTRGGSLGRQILIPSLFLLIVIAIAVWVASRAEMRVERIVRDQLEKLRDSTETGLRIWLESREDAAAFAAAQDGVEEHCRDIAEQRASGADARAIQNAEAFIMLKRKLEGVASRYGTGDFVLIDRTGETIAAVNPTLIGMNCPADRTDAFAFALSGQSIVSRPFLSEYAGQLIGRSHTPTATMFAFTPVRDASGRVSGVLGLRVDPRGRFSGVLQGARIGASGEAYLVDREGKMLTMSRFERELESYGLLQAGQSSVLNIDVRDPKCDLTQGERRAPEVHCEWTELVAGLRHGSEDSSKTRGINVGGYSDYRGVKVVGAWSWLDKYGMGLATEIDHQEAYAEMRFIRQVLFGAIALLVLSLGAVTYGSVMFGRLRRKMQRQMQLGQYTLERKIGSGGMGQVYLARHELLRRPTALKVLDVGGTTRDDRLRFEKEVQLTSELEHPNTITIYDYGHTPDGVFYYVMEYLEGLDLQSFVQKFGPCAPGRVVRILDQICASLEEAHEHALIHRDIKPANIIVCERGGAPDVVKVLDFGLVKELDPGSSVLTQKDALSGTPGYLAPEVIRQPRAADVRSDLYCVAAIGYFLLTGRQVFPGSTVLDVLDKHLHNEPVSPSSIVNSAVPAELERLIMQTLSKEPDDRPQTASAFRLALKHSGVTWHERLAHAWWAAHRHEIRSDLDGGPVTPTGAEGKGVATLEIDRDSWHQSLDTQ